MSLFLPRPCQQPDQRVLILTILQYVCPFPSLPAGQEVVQPVVADAASFAAWRSEAFALWTADWAACYEEGNASKATLQNIADSW